MSAVGHYADALGLVRLPGETDGELLQRIREIISDYGPSMTQWKIRQKTTGLFWNGARWAKLEGVFHEQAAVELDAEREMVQLVATAPKRDMHAEVLGQHPYPATQRGQAEALANAYSYMQQIAKINAPLRASNRPSEWPTETHPNTGEEFISGTMRQETGEQLLGSFASGTIRSPVGGAGLLRGSFLCESGSSVEGYYQGGSWTWTSVVVKQR